MILHKKGDQFEDKRVINMRLTGLHLTLTFHSMTLTSNKENYTASNCWKNPRKLTLTLEIKLNTFNRSESKLKRLSIVLLILWMNTTELNSRTVIKSRPKSMHIQGMKTSQGEDQTSLLHLWSDEDSLTLSAQI